MQSVLGKVFFKLKRELESSSILFVAGNENKLIIAQGCMGPFAACVIDRRSDLRDSEDLTSPASCNPRYFQAKKERTLFFVIVLREKRGRWDFDRPIYFRIKFSCWYSM